MRPLAARTNLTAGLCARTSMASVDGSAPIAPTMVVTTRSLMPRAESDVFFTVLFFRGPRTARREASATGPAAAASQGAGCPSRPHYRAADARQKLATLRRIRLRNGRIRLAELHWYEAHGIGKKRGQTQKVPRPGVPRAPRHTGSL